jgi:hypothetical protein
LADAPKLADLAASIAAEWFSWQIADPVSTLNEGSASSRAFRRLQAWGERDEWIMAAIVRLRMIQSKLEGEFQR